MEPTHGSGRSLAELEEIARAVGIRPTAPARRPPSSSKHHDLPNARSEIWGGPFILRRKLLIVKVLTGNERERVVEEMRRVTGSESKTQEFSRARDWSRAIQDLDDTIEETSMTLLPGDGVTAVEIRKQYRGGTLMAYMLTIFFSGSAAGDRRPRWRRLAGPDECPPSRG